MMYKIQTSENFFKRFTEMQETVRKLSRVFQNPDAEITEQEHDEFLVEWSNAEAEFSCLKEDSIMRVRKDGFVVE